MFNDTIIAQASAPGSAIRGILRISGKHALLVTKTIVENPDALNCPGCVDANIVLPSLLSPLSQVTLPARLLLWKEGHSYTGEETVEIHTFGSPVLLDAIMAALLTQKEISVSDCVRLANPGEFTLRAFLSGRLDLAQAEAVLGVIDADNGADLKTALHQLAGNVSAPLSAVRTLLWDTLAQLEASLDFVDEEIPAVSTQELQRTLADAYHQLEHIRRKIAQRGIAEGKPKIVLTGLPNVGKSTLFNKLVQKEVALVSPLAGTTRDYLEAEINWEGIPVALMDTAGIGGTTSDSLDESVQANTQELLKRADVIIHCDDKPATERAGNCVAEDSKTILFQTKTPNESLELLRNAVSTFLRNRPEYGMLPNTALRCRESLSSAEESLLRAQNLTDGSLIALELRNAVNQLGLIDGTVHTEDMLDTIFSRFCVGK